MKLIEEKSFNSLVRIAEHMHGSYYMYYENSKWMKIKTDALFTAEMSQDEKIAVLVFASFHSNGYLREKALIQLSYYPNTLKYILIRRNDWVDEVRNTVKKLLIDKYKNLTDGELLSTIPAIERLVKGERDNFKEEYDVFILKLQNYNNELNNGLKSDAPKIRLFCAELLLKQDYKIENLNSYLNQERIPYIRERIYNIYLGCDLVVDNDILEKVLTDKYAKIRIMGKNYIYINKLCNIDFFSDFLLDCNANVRDFARYIITQMDKGFSFRNYYIEQLENGDITAIIGLGETGTKEDALLLENYLNTNIIKVVRMTLNALIKLNKEKYIKGFIPLLDDDRIGIAKDVATILNKEAQLYEEEIKDIFNLSKREFTRLKCAKLLFSVSKWNALNHMVLALNDEDSVISDLAKLSIEKWIEKFNKSFTTLSSKQKEIIIENISKIKRKDIDLKQLLYYVI